MHRRGYCQDLSRVVTIGFALSSFVGIILDFQSFKTNLFCIFVYGRIQIKSLYQGGAGTAIQPTLAGGHSPAELVPMDETKHLADEGTTGARIQQVPA